MSLLRPGLHVVRRDDRHLQIGLDPPWRLVVPDDADVQRLLSDLVAGRPPSPATAAGHRALRDLRGAGMLRAERPLATGRVRVVGPAELTEEAKRLLRTEPATVVDGPGAADLALVLAAGEPDRSTVDEHLREGRTHLVVAAGSRGWRVGPFVVPGETACLRCVDAHLGERDPRRAVAVEQLAGRTAMPEDAVLRILAIAWAVRDVHLHLAGRRPTTWSATIDFDADPDEADPGPAQVTGPDPGARLWARHPWCGCTWDALAAGHLATD